MPNQTEGPESLRFEREALSRYMARFVGFSTHSQLHAQVAPRAEEEQRILALPVASRFPPVQDSRGRFYHMIDYDPVDDPTHPIR
jgi:hypothetical protein